MPAPGHVLRKLASQAVHGQLLGRRQDTSVAPARSTDTHFPHCPVCTRTMNLTYDTAQAWTGAPMMFFCPDDNTVLRRVRGTGDFLRMAYTEDGDLVPYAATTGAR